jgi:YidC/Oxa1 family membrane protein insertase
MERSSVLRWGVIAIAIVFFWLVVLPHLDGSKDKPQASSLPSEVYVDAPDFPRDVVDPAEKPGFVNTPPAEGELCTLKGDRFEAVASARGAALVHVQPTDKQYAGFDISSTPKHERWRSLRTLFRGADANSQVKFDRFLWKLAPPDDQKKCEFSYEDESVRIIKTLAAGRRPFEINVETRVTNLAGEPKRHQMSIGAYAFRFNKDVKGSLGRQSPLQTELSAANREASKSS